MRTHHWPLGLFIDCIMLKNTADRHTEITTCMNAYQASKNDDVRTSSPSTLYVNKEMYAAVIAGNGPISNPVTDRGTDRRSDHVSGRVSASRLKKVRRE